MKKLTTLKNLYLEFLRDLYNAEVLQVSELIYFKEHAGSIVLKELIEAHINDSRAQMSRLEDLIDNLNQSLLEDHCRTMRSMIDEAKVLVDRCQAGPIKDFAIISSLQRINQCEISVQRGLILLANKLSLDNDVEKLQKSLEEEMIFQDSLKDKASIIDNIKYHSYEE